MKHGNVVRGGYSGGEYYENHSEVTITAKTRKKTEQEIERVTKKHTCSGSQIDFGYVSGTSNIQWDPQLWKLVE